MANQSWSVGILCYNEQDAIIKVIEDCISTLDKMNCNYELLVVNDGSKDNSLALISKYKEESNRDLKIINHTTNMGIGAGLRSIYGKSTMENVVAICGDGQFDISQIIPFQNIEDKTVIAFYRLDNTIYSLRRNILSAINKYLNKFLLGINIKDVNWVKVYKKTELASLKLVSKSSLIESEICSKLYYNNNIFKEVESKYLDRIGGVSKGSSIKIILQAVANIALLFINISTFRIKKLFKI